MDVRIFERSVKLAYERRDQNPRGGGGGAILSGDILALYLKIDICIIILFVFPVHKNRILCETKLIQRLCVIKNKFLFILKKVINIYTHYFF